MPAKWKPARLKNITISPAVRLPKMMQGKEYFIFVFKKTATAEPVHTPVSGSGTATNKNRERYFTNSKLLFRLRSLCSAIKESSSSVHSLSPCLRSARSLTRSALASALSATFCAFFSKFRQSVCYVLTFAKLSAKISL